MIERVNPAPLPAGTKLQHQQQQQQQQQQTTPERQRQHCTQQHPVDHLVTGSAAQLATGMTNQQQQQQQQGIQVLQRNAADGSSQSNSASDGSHAVQSGQVSAGEHPAVGRPTS